MTSQSAIFNMPSREKRQHSTVPRRSSDDANLGKIRAVCEHIRENSATGEPLTLERLGKLAGLSPFHLQRTFKAALGVTPKQYAEACRVASLKSELRAGRSVTDAVYEAGFGSSSRVYERADSRLGMTPAEYRAGGEGLQISYVCTDTPLGLLLIGATDRGLCAIELGDSEDTLLAELKGDYPRAAIQKSEKPWPELTLWTDSLVRYLQGESISLDLPLHIRATAFQLKVWRYLQTIPSGEVRTYSQVAEAIGAPRAARAVGSACGSNPVSLVIPCHRVIRGDQGLGGYRWGLDRKRKLLQREARG